MDPVKTLSYLKKTLTLLKSQIEKAKIKRTYTIIADAIIYQEGLSSSTVSTIGLKRENDFLDDLHTVTTTLRNVEVPLEQN
ncbi:34061_t:CDS:2 [Gigaspora margarita]|uniref:34061_t:CDS:1 n=1 Tax=Gigaspora margarita TaxID=4874 RepID=A0ABN7UHI4_GIGMA|nr:34061_t:CDS:2 [Gigaspora margarita]